MQTDKSKRQLRLPSPAMVVALLALCVALGGTAVAAGVIIKSHSIGANKLTKGLLKRIDKPGPQGEKGDIGSSGKDGFNGVNGVNGVNGAGGKDGVNGNDGANGTNGTNGTNGKDGINGVNGNDGANGTNGVNGTNGANGTDGKDGKDGEKGDPGSQGSPGESAIKTITATTAVTSWPETSGWANDEFSRTLILTRNYAVSSARCNGTPSCWFYTGKLADSGSFTTVNGHASPNTSSASTINGELTGSIVGEATLEFYASSDSPDASFVPAAQEYEAGVSSTSRWAQQAFSPGTVFVNSSGSSPLTAYKWVYSLGCAEQTWIDQINPGDDGGGEGDGNITAACTP